MAAAKSAPAYFWACLRRPANPFAPVSAANPMVVVDSVRFPYIEGTGPLTANTATPPVPAGYTMVPAPTTGNTIYSVQRFQPYRGGHAVPVPQVVPTIPAPVDTRYGYSEQIVVPGVNSQLLKTQGLFSTMTYPSTQLAYHTIGWANEYEQGSYNSLAENWDYFTFHDRDYTSVAELLLVPGCPPGLFTKQFVEFAPSYNTVTNIFSQVTPLLIPALPASGGESTNRRNRGRPGPTHCPNPTTVQVYNTASTPLAFPAIYTSGALPPNPYAYFYTTGEGLRQRSPILSPT